MGHALPGAVRIGRVGVTLAAGLLVASLLPFGPVATVLGVTTVTPATGGGAIKADTAGIGGSGSYTALAGPVITEGAAGELLNNGEVWLTVPAGFEFNPASGTAAPGGATCAGMTLGAPVRSTTTIKVQITAPSTGACAVTFSGVGVRPTTGNPIVSGNITNTGSTGPTGISYGALTMIVGDPAKLAFTQQPSTSPSATSFATQPKVAVRDAVGNTITTDNTTKVTVAIKGLTPTAGSGTLTCPTTGLEVTVTAGVATFAGCRITGLGIGFKLTATDTTGGGAPHPFSPADSAAFDIPDNLGFETQPGGGLGTGSRAQGGIAFTNQPKVTVRIGTTNFTNKAVNDTTTTVTLSIKSGTGTAGAILTCDQASNALKVTVGSAQFTGCKIDKAGTGYQLVATSVPAYGTNAWTSTAFDVVAGLASKLTFTTQPAGAAAGQAFTTQPVIAITDAGGNVATTGVSANVTLTIGTNPGVPAGVLTCTPSQTVSTATTGLNAGKAVFSGCKIGNSGVGYTLVASATSVVCAAGACATPGVLSPATSSAFTVTSPAAQITLTPSASVITWGGTVVLTTRFLVNGAGKTFLLQGARDGVNWTTIQTLITDVNGNSSYAYRPATNLFYKVVFAGTSDLIAGTTNTTRVVARQIAILRPTNFGAIKSIARNTSIKFTTTVRPSRPELPAAKVSFVFYRQIGGVWTFIAKRDVYINSLGLASWTWKFSTAGSWYVRAIANPTPYNANSVWSPLERYTVR